MFRLGETLLLNEHPFEQAAVELDAGVFRVAQFLKDSQPLFDGHSAVVKGE